MKNRLLLISIIIAAPTLSAHSVVLRNGSRASEQQVEKVYKSLKKLIQCDSLQYFWLWRTARIGNKLKQNNCILSELFKEADMHYLRPLEQKTLLFLEAEEITKDGILNKETQDIIISSYYGTLDPKIVSIQYPVPSFLERLFS